MKKSILIIGVFFGFFSCEKVLELDQETRNSKLVVNSLFNTQEAWQVDVTRSLSVIDNGSLDKIENATVSIFEGNNLVSNLTYDGEKYVVLGLSAPPIAGKRYRVEVSAPNYTSVSAEDVCPVAVPLLQADTSSAPGSFGGRTLTCNISFQDPAGIDNYYGISLERATYYIAPNSSGGFDTLLSDVWVNYINSSSPIIDNAGSNNFAQTLTFKDNLFDGNRVSFSFSSDDFGWSNPSDYVEYTIKFYSFSEATYNYTKTYEAYQNTSGDPFAEPVQVFTNVTNGFGIFGGRSVFEYKF